MQSKAPTVSAYLAELEPQRRREIEAVRKVIRANLNEGFEEGMQYGMIGYFVPHRVYPAGYHCDPSQPVPFAGLASQKQAMSLYLMSVYGDAEQERRLREGFARAGKKLDMGKSCIRFRRAEDLPLEVIGEMIRGVTCGAYLERYEASRSGGGRGRAAAKKPGAKPKARAKKAGIGAGKKKAGGRRGKR